MAAAAYEKFFREADKDGSGFLSFDELVEVLRKNGRKEPESCIKQIFARCDKSGDGKLSLQEFLSEMGENDKQQQLETEFAETCTVVTTTKLETTKITETRPPTKYELFFREADKDNSGFLSFDELVDILRKIGLREPESRMKRMFEKCDTSGDGKISLEEFLKEMGQEEIPESETFVEEKREVVTQTQTEKLMTQTSQSKPVSKYEQFFRDADKDNSGFLSFDELVGILRKNGFTDPESKIKRMFARCDTSGDGKISLEEFLAEMEQSP